MSSAALVKLLKTFQRLFVIGSLLSVGAMVAPVTGLTCYECTGEESQAFCNTTASVRSCPGQEICVLQLNQRPEKVTSFRGCLNYTVCQELERGNDRGCLQGRVANSCSWCCSSDYCNHDGFPQIETVSILDSGLSELTTGATIPALVTVSDCLSAQNFAEKCLAQLQDGIQSVIRGNQSGFSSFCRSIPELFQCFIESSAACGSNGDPRPDIGAFHLVWEKLRHSCPGSCNKTAALDCILEIFDDIVSFLKNGSVSICDDLLRKVRNGYRCIARDVSSCEDDEITMATNDLVLRDLESAVLRFCLILAPDDDLESDPSSLTRVGLAPCELEEAMDCISRAGVEVIRNRIERNGLDALCNGTSSVEANLSCARSRSDTCALVRRKRALLAEGVVDQLLGRACDTGDLPRKCNTTSARLCIIDLLHLAESSDVHNACNLIEYTKSSVKFKIENCTENEKEYLNRTLDQVLKIVAERCTPHFQCLSNETIFLTEGGRLETVEVRLTAPPESICRTPRCKIHLDVFIQSDLPPKCRNKSPFSQFVVSSGDLSFGGSADLCSRHITVDNWDRVQVFHLAAKIDFKYDNTQQRALRVAMRKVVNGTLVESRTICEHKVVIIDGDRQSVCQSITDPHIITFDGRAYNNYLEGFFTLYRHQMFPYEVQVAFQRCVNGGATCNCAVAVRAGDSVFFVDRCRKRPSSDFVSSGVFCGGSHPSRVACTEFAKAEIFYHGKVTPGFHVFRRGESGFELLLPHGTRVVIRGNAWYNVYVYPSPFDWNKTEGLCGTYDHQPRNDLTLRNGRLFRESLSHRAEPPLDFSLDWRVPDNQLLLNGVEKSPFRLPVYCDCDEGFDPDGSPRSLCGSTRFLELCDFNSEGEITLMLPKGQQRSQEVNPQLKKSRRDISGGNSAGIYDFNLDPDIDIGPVGNWTKAAALSFCEDRLLNESTAIRNCHNHIPDFDAGFAVESCVEDLLLSGDTSFVGGTLDLLKAQCIEHLVANVSLYNSDEGRYISLEVEESLCQEDCGRHGLCFRGKCHCEEGFLGSSCSIPVGAKPCFFDLENGGLCDLDHTNCSWAVGIGEPFINSTDLVCLVEKLEFDTNGTFVIVSNATYAARFITTHQVICPTGEDNVPATYLISVSNDGATFSDRRLFSSRDFRCYECSSSSSNGTDGEFCRRKVDTCLVSGRCFSSGEEHYSDPCLICDPSKSTVELHRRRGHGCSSHSQTVLTAVIVALLAVVCLIAVVLVFRLKRKDKRSVKQQPKDTENPKEQQSLKGCDNVAMEAIAE